MDEATILALVIGGAGLLLSLYNTYDARKIRRQQMERYKKEEQDGKKADVMAMAQTYKDSRGRPRHRIEVCNQGRAMARNVRIETKTDHWSLHSFTRDKFPMEIMHPQQPVFIPASIHMGSPLKQRVTLLWEDDISLTNEKHVDLTF